MIGIELNLTEYSWDEYYQALCEGNFTIARNGWVMDVDDPVNILEPYMTESEDNVVHLPALLLCRVIRPEVLKTYKKKKTAGRPL